MFDETVGRAVVEFAFKGHAQEQIEATRKKLIEAESQARRTGTALNKAAAGPGPMASATNDRMDNFLQWQRQKGKLSEDTPRPWHATGLHLDGPSYEPKNRGAVAEPTLADLLPQVKAPANPPPRTVPVAAAATPANPPPAGTPAMKPPVSAGVPRSMPGPLSPARAGPAATASDGRSNLQREMNNLARGTQQVSKQATPFGERLAATGREGLALAGGVMAAVYALGRLVEVASPQTWNTFTGHLQLLASTIGSKLIPVFNSLSAAIEDVDDWLRETFKSNEEGKPWDDPKTAGFWGQVGGAFKDVALSQINPQNWIPNALTGGQFGLQRALFSRAGSWAGVPGADQIREENNNERQPRLKSALMPGLPPAQVSSPEEYGNRLLVSALNKDDIQTELARRTAEATEEIARQAAGGRQDGQNPPAWR